MHKNKNRFYDQIKDLKTKNEFEEEIKKRQKEYDNLLDEDTTALLIVDELGRNKQNISRISDLKPDTECTVFGKVAGIHKSKNFTRKNGSSGTVVNLELTDDTGICRLVLWNRDAELVRNNTIQKGTNIKLINGYIKNGFNGLELNTGRWSLIEIEPGDKPDFNNEQPIDYKMIKGALVEMEPTRAFFRDDGEFGFVTNIKIKDEKGIKQVTLWDEKVREIQGLHQGDLIEIDNIDMRQKNGETEIHVNGRSTIRRL